MRRVIAFSIAAMGFLLVLGAGYYQYTRQQNTIYHLTHTVIKCDGKYIVVQSNQDTALQWAGRHCVSDNRVDYELVANQDYDSQAQ